MGLGSGIRNRDPGYGKKPFPDQGVKKAPDPGFESGTLVNSDHVDSKVGLYNVVD
jgi:hypothetical protein